MYPMFFGESVGVAAQMLAYLMAAAAALLGFLMSARG